MTFTYILNIGPVQVRLSMSESSKAIHVLHVDDEPAFADVAATFLERNNGRITVQTATNPSDGLDVLTDHDIDCIVSDYDMPEQNGIEFLGVVREHYPDLPFILYTGKGSEEVASDAISTGVTDYLQKVSGTSQYTVLANRISNAVEQYRSRQAVQETEQKLSELAERTDDILFMFDGDWSELLFINSAYEEIWGRSIEQLEKDSKSFIEHVHPEDLEKCRESMEQLTQGEASQIEYRVVRSDEEQRWVRGDTQPILNQDDNVVRIVGQVRDITKQKERELHLETIIENLPGYVYRHDYEPEYPLQFVKGDAESITGYTTTELEEDVILAEEIIHPEDREELWADHLKGIEATGRFDSTYRIIAKGGEIRWIHDQGQLIEDPVTGEDVIEGFITDVSEHIQREQELRNQQTFINESLDALQDVYYALTENGELIHWNERVAEVTGYTDEEIDGKEVAEFFTDEHRDQVRESIKEAIETGSSVVQADVLTTDGERVPYEFRGTRFAAPNQEQIAAVGVGRDISDQITREEKLERIRDFFTEAERLGDLGAWEFDAGGTIVWTDGTRRIHGVNEEFDPTIEQAIEFFHPEDRAMIEQAIEAAVENGESYDLELRLITAQGDQRWVRTRGKALTDEEPQAIRGFIQDITQRKEQERKLTRIERAMDEAPVGITITDPMQDDNPLIYANDGFKKLTGYSEDDILGRNCRFLQGEATDPEPVVRMREAIDQQERVSVELRNYRKDGTEFWNCLSITPVYDEDESLVNYVGFQQDISERKLREK